jgi:hypothetical protein
MNFETEFKKELIDKFNEKKYGRSKDKSLSESSIKLYIRNLEKLNEDMPLKNLNFLQNVDKIEDKLKPYKENTKRGYLISICSALSTDKTTKKKEKIYNEYYKLLSKKNTELKDLEGKNEMSEQQKKNWISWDDVKQKFEDLKEKVDGFKTSKDINEHNYNILLQYIILALYYYKPPRRNQDYYKMYVIKSYTHDLPITENYLDYDKKEFIFNIYKTSKTDGIQHEKITDDLLVCINNYFKFHPLIKGKKILKNSNIPFLVYYNGSLFNKVNCITRILNKTFGKSVGSSMLRHIFLTNKYGDVIEEQKEDAKAMGHSLEQQKDYVKKTK